ncbi:bifunctional tRNA (adenosine(37)-N6)-threonylcarbamoyltransferase complex ATPase subunit type 1 TsaE/phosphotransferase [Chelatococcus reniformis]|uniref:tRNA threonylcarbamoyladenosine biosynthesis protein TsaE n=2 Tax=Chelatococcus reniformis TaxID=1494448 RepID=A0A916X6I3_9HYPH|nr:bifunctional tRNA (adenosine(37)-N6)-threonylcarbamoyltransferase complex ATPase subunit type 1 TsaE/phosphotransferase [Chelatococcus reniformis]
MTPGAAPQDQPSVAALRGSAATGGRAQAPAPAVGEAEGPTATWTLDLPDEDATLALARVIAEMLRPGDLVTLSGDLGSGKSTLARALVRTLAQDPSVEVPSPTFTLIQQYDTPAGSVVHADLYRISGPDDLLELGWEEATAGAIALVEWPERAQRPLARDRLDVMLRIAPDGASHRFAVMTGFGAWADRLAIARAIRSVLAQAGWHDAGRAHLQGDASTRAYERLTKPSGATAILMISPRRPDGPAIRRGKPYSAIAHLAESVHAFVAMANGLRALDISAPEIMGADLDAGVLLVEDLGDAGVVDDGVPLPARYEAAAHVLARLHAIELPHTLPVADGIDHVIPPYDLDALMIEVELLLDWYLPANSRALPALARSQFTAAWNEVLRPVVAAKPTWALRDYHSPNLIWLPDRAEAQRLGVIDFQDTVLGHPAYDAVSLFQDARVTVPADLELKLLSAYARARQAAEADFELPAFAQAYAVLGAQRATKLLGIFTRLDRRDGKPQYLKHLPRIEAYLRRDLAHPMLAPVKAWYETHLPRLLADDAG